LSAPPVSRSATADAVSPAYTGEQTHDWAASDEAIAVKTPASPIATRGVMCSQID
jgi:hypothetical protein